MGKKRVYIVAGILALIGFALFLHKAVVVGYPIWPDEKVEGWQIEVRASFDRTPKGPVDLRVFVPRPTTRWALLERRVVAPLFGISTLNADLNQQVSLTRREVDGKQTIYFQFVIQQTRTAEYTPPPAIREARPHQLKDAQLAAASRIVTAARAQSSDDRSLVLQLLKRVTAKSPEDGIAVLLGPRRDRRRQMVALVDLLRVAEIQAHMVNGLELGATRRRATLKHWIEARIDGQWVPFSPETGQQGVSPDLMPWWRGRERLVTIVGQDAAQKFKVTRNIAFQHLEQSALSNVLSMEQSRGQGQMLFSLFVLPVRTQEVYRLLVVVPLAIFLLVLLRNVIGITTLGTFMPVLIALAFRETGLLWGVILFGVVVGVGLLVRAGMEGLKLLLVPRLAAVLICVILIMAIMSLVSHRLGLDSGLSVALFPMVILTMTIERLSILWDERGGDTALKQAGGSLIVAILCYLLMRWSLLEYWFFAFPELLLVLLALTLLLGRYTGYRLTEIGRFKVLAGKAA